MKLPGPANTPLSILYVEDNQEARDLLLSMLARHYPDLDFIAADNGLHGLEQFTKARPAVVITDIGMPGMDGLNLAARIKALESATIIIALTANSETTNLLRAIAIGVNYYLLKPLQYERVCAVLEHAVNTYRKEQQLQDQYRLINELNATLTTRTADLELINNELEAFNYTVAHDLRSPLVNINSFSQYLLDHHESSLDETSSEYLRSIYRETRRMSSIIDALLNFSHLSRQSIVKKWVDCSGMAREIIGNLKLREPQRTVACTVAQDVHAFADPVLLSVVLENLLGNAWKYTANNDAAQVDFGVISLTEELVYYVRDNGVGFDQQDLARLFVPFQRQHGNEEFAGFGIGLATASRIVQRHGGKIWAEGERGHGATFYFSL